MPLTLVILAIVFSVQRFGTGGVALIFGPITAVWFLAIGLSGLNHIIDDPEILLAVSPHYIVAFLINSPDVAFVTIGAIFLAVTGAEALYADLGHFGRKPIVLAWLAIVFPCLLLNYVGQGAFVLAHGGVVGHPFFEMNQGWTLIPMVVLATAATVIASQAVISGAFSLTQAGGAAQHAAALGNPAHVGKAVRPDLHAARQPAAGAGGDAAGGRLRRIQQAGLRLRHFGDRQHAGDDGAAVRRHDAHLEMAALAWRSALTALFAFIDIGFFASNIVKVFEGGWASLAVAFTIVLAMWTWVRGSRYLFDKTRRNEIPLDFLAGNLLKKKPQLVSGTAVFLTSDPQSAPTALMHSLKHYKVLHEQNVILSVVTAPQPLVPDSERVKMETVNELFMRVTLTFGYMEQPNIPRALAICRKQGWKFDIMTTSFFLSRRSLKASPNSGMPVWQDKLFIGLARTAADATEYFQIPTGRVVEIGTQVAI